MLHKALEKNKGLIRFHTPGHSGNLEKELLALDVTELPYSDNLLEAKGEIKALEEAIAKIYGVKRALISTNGATSCILTALYSRKNTGGFFVLKNAHSSVHNGIALSGEKCLYSDSLPTASFARKNNIKTIIVTSPDYFGMTERLAEIRSLCDEIGAVLAIDASHGSHFVFNEKLPVSASVCGDMVIHSLHKTLPVATGGAVLLINNEELIPSCIFARRLFHSTSPSYITMASISSFVYEKANFLKEKYHEIFAEISRFSTAIEAAKSFIRVEKTDDFSRLVLSSPFDGYALFDRLIEKGFALETAFENKVVAIVTPYNFDKLRLLAATLLDIDGLPLFDAALPEKSTDKGLVFDASSLAEKGFELVPLAGAEGRIAYCSVGLYPPGTPVIRQGQTYTSAIISLLNKNITHTYGLDNGCVYVVQ